MTNPNNTPNSTLRVLGRNRFGQCCGLSSPSIVRIVCLSASFLLGPRWLRTLALLLLLLLLMLLLLLLMLLLVLLLLLVVHAAPQHRRVEAG